MKAATQLAIKLLEFSFGPRIDRCWKDGFRRRRRLLPRPPVLLLDRLPAVARAAGEHVAGRQAAELASQDVGGVDLHVHELAPFLGMGVKALHEARVAVATAVLAARVTVERVVVNAAAV